MDQGLCTDEKKDDACEREHHNRFKEMDGIAHKAVAQQHKAGRQSLLPNSPKKDLKILTIDLSSIPDIRKVEPDYNFNSHDSANAPVWFESKVQTEDSGTLLNAALERFNKSENARFARGSEFLAGRKATQAPPNAVHVDGTKAFEKITPQDASFLCTPWSFIMGTEHKCVGPEYGCLPCVRYIERGQRTCILVEFTSLKQFTKGTIGVGGSLTMQAMLNRVSGADQDMLKALLGAGVKMFKATLGAGTWCFQPWGFVTVEMTNPVAESAICAGFRYLSVNDYPSSSFFDMASFMCPSEPQSIKANSVQAILAKVLKAVQGLEPAEQAMQTFIKHEHLDSLVSRASIKLDPEPATKKTRVV